jgi:multimeric flavodoxin WrbA
MKVGAAVLSSRRAGSTSAFDEINKYFTVTSMLIVSSTYWNEVHGYTAQDVEADVEGLQTMRNLARNMVFLLNAIDNQKAITSIPQKEWGVFTNFRSK